MIINGISILTLIAAEQEYGKKMQQQRIEPRFIGIGPIEASFQTTKLLMELSQKNNLPDVIFSVGTAGSSKLEQSELYQINQVSYRDMDASAFGFEKGTTPYASYPAHFQLPVLFSDMPVASLSTGAAVIEKNGRSGGVRFSDIHADAVDMETYAVIRVAYDFDIPVIALRGISDGSDDTVGISSWEEYLDVIDEKIANFYVRLHHENVHLIRFIAQTKSRII